MVYLDLARIFLLLRFSLRILFLRHCKLNTPLVEVMTIRETSKEYNYEARNSIEITMKSKLDLITSLSKRWENF